MKDLYVIVVKASLPSWYEKRIGEVFRVYRKKAMYCGGIGYKCRDILGGILVSDCEIVTESTR